MKFAIETLNKQLQNTIACRTTCERSVQYWADKLKEAQSAYDGCYRDLAKQQDNENALKAALVALEQQGRTES